jgi:hypothetical protein
MFLCKYSKQAILEGSIVLSSRKFFKLVRLFTIVSSSPCSSYCTIPLSVLLVQHVVAHLYYARRLIWKAFIYLLLLHTLLILR